MVGPRNYPLTIVNVELLVGDATRDLLPVAGTQSRYLINEIRFTSTTSAAQTISVGGATNTLAKIGASIAVGAQEIFQYGDGFLMAINEKLTSTQVAGPGGWYQVKYAKLPEFGNA